jgi:AP-3 complex subunit beta
MHILCKSFFLELIFYLGHITESFISNSVHLDGEDAVLVQAILSIKAIVKMDPVSHEKVLVSLVYMKTRILLSATCFSSSKQYFSHAS